MYSANEHADGACCSPRDRAGPSEACHGLQPEQDVAPRSHKQLRTSDDPGCLFVAFGTRGDVLPLFLLARDLVASGCFRLTFVSHDAHSRSFNWSEFGIEFVGVPTDPWERAASVDAEYEPAVVAAVDCSVVVFNLFALGAWHIAEARGLRAVAASPCLIPYSNPVDFSASFKASFPQLYAWLIRGGEGQVCWAEVEHWMWPLWTERWGKWRRARLGVSEIPMEDYMWRCKRLPPPTPLLYGISSSLVPRPPFWPHSVVVCGFWIEAEPYDRPAEWNDGSKEINRCHSLPSALKVWEAPMCVPGPPTEKCALTQILEGPHFMYIGFGSASAALVSSGMAARIGGAAIRVATSLAIPIVLHSCGNSSLAACWQCVVDQVLNAKSCNSACQVGHSHALSKEEKPGNDGAGGSLRGDAVHVLDDVVDLYRLLCRASVAIHHGGSGTVATAIHAGIPQIIFPQHFDQFSWAERIEHAGIGFRLHQQCPTRRHPPSMQDSDSKPTGADFASPALDQVVGTEETFEKELCLLVKRCRELDVADQCSRMARAVCCERGLEHAGSILQGVLHRALPS